MKVMDYSLIRNGADTKTMQDLGQVLGMKPQMSRAVVTMYPQLSLQNITEALGRVYKKDAGKTKSEQLSSFSFEWDIQTNQIPDVEFAEDCTEDGYGGAEFRVVFKKKYYDPHDVFRLNNKQLLFVKRPGRMLAPNKWEYWVKLVSGDTTRTVDTSYMRTNSKTYYVSNYHPELSERGYNKYMFNTERHRNYISRHRVGDSVSGDWANLKETFLEHAGAYFKMKDVDKSLLDHYYFSREMHLIWGRSNFDANGKCTDVEADGRPIPMGDGLIAQIERFCGQQRYLKLTIQHLRNAIEDVVGKLASKTGNTIMVKCNWRFYIQVQALLDEALTPRATDNYFYTVEGNKLTVGAEYNAYKFAGNKIVFVENAALTQEYPDHGYAVYFDLGYYDGEPNISLQTLKGSELIRGFLPGMGGESGTASGNIATTVHGNRIEYLGYSGIKVGNPYGAHIMEEHVLF
jgi:hypothetical protein